MDWIFGIQDAVDYLDHCLTEQVDYEKAAQKAGMSVYHFMRIFTILAGFPVGEYVRNRRLTMAGQELTRCDVKILDIALKYGYETHESFTKAFCRFHGVNPSEARKAGAQLKSVGKLSIHVTLKGEKALHYQIVERESFALVGKKEVISNQNGINFKQIPDFCQRCAIDGTCEKLFQLCTPEWGMMGVCTNMRENDFDYYMATVYEGGPVPKGMELLEISKFTWVVFESVGPIPEAIQDVWQRIFSEWFPTSGYEHANGPELEVYGPGDMHAPNYQSSVWLPVIRTK